MNPIMLQYFTYAKTFNFYNYFICDVKPAQKLVAVRYNLMKGCCEKLHDPDLLVLGWGEG